MWKYIVYVYIYVWALKVKKSIWLTMIIIQPLDQLTLIRILQKCVSKQLKGIFNLL
jgi:hypothetical protein